MSEPLPEPHSHETEQAVLAVVLLDPARLEDVTLEPADFYDARHRAIFEAYRELAANDDRIDLRTVQAHLEAKGEDVGGIAYLAQLDDALPEPSGLTFYVEVIRERSRRRRLTKLARGLLAQAPRSETDVEELTARTRRELELLEEVVTGTVEAADLVDRVLRDVERRRAEHELTGDPVLGLRTGLGSLDRLLGGLDRGLYLLAGAPGVGKTSLALQTALHVAAHEGVPVIYLSFENAATGLLLNILAARAGVSSQDVRRGYIAADSIREAAEQLGPALERLVLLDGDGRWTVGQLRATARRAMEAHGARRCLVVVDYLQLWAKVALEYRGVSEVRGKVDALAGDLLDLARRLDSPVLALSSQSRASGYSSSNLDTLKESGDLEYSADAALFLTEAEDGAATPPARSVHLTVRKHRHGPTGQVGLVFRPDLGTLRELAPA